MKITLRKIWTSPSSSFGEISIVSVNKFEFTPNSYDKPHIIALGDGRVTRYYTIAVIRLTRQFALLADWTCKLRAPSPEPLDSHLRYAVALRRLGFAPSFVRRLMTLYRRTRIHGSGLETQIEAQVPMLVKRPKSEPMRLYQFQSLPMFRPDDCSSEHNDLQDMNGHGD